MSEPALRFERVTRRFGRKTALDAVDLEVAPGSVLGLLGRNGAGKTTALRLALGMLWADGGRVATLGLDPMRDALAVRTRASLLAEESALYPWMTVAEVVRFAAGLHPRWDASLADDLATRLDLDRTARIRDLSRGTRAKVALLLAVAVRPKLLLLDDPTAGLDPLVRREVLEAILDAVSGEGGAVVYASHLVHDVERVADRVVVLDTGRITLQGTVDDLKARIRRAVAVFDREPPAAPEIPGALDLERDGRVLEVVGDGAVEPALRALGAASVTLEPLGLEDILVACLRHGGPRETADA